MNSNVRRKLVMDQVIKVRKQLILEQWKSIVTECCSGGMTVIIWCKVNDIVE